MTSTLDSIIKGLELAAAKGCPVESIWVNEAAHAELTRWNGDQAIYDFRGHHISVVRMDNRYLIKLECGWTDMTGRERTDINALDAHMETPNTPKIDTGGMEEHPQWGTF